MKSKPGSKLTKKKKTRPKWLKSPFGRRIRTGKAELSPKLCCADTLQQYSEKQEWKLRNNMKRCLGKVLETGHCEKQPKKPHTEKQTEMKIKTSESKEVRPLKEGSS